MISIKTAAIVGLSLLGVLLGIDVYLAIDGLKGNTWSEMLRMWSLKNFFVTWVWGGLGGHFFHWWAKGYTTGDNVVTLVWVSLAVMLLGVVVEHFVGIQPWMLGLTFIVAFVVWGFLWPV